jgi:hypothetical protein
VTTYEDDIRKALKIEFDLGYLTEVGPAKDIFDLLMKAYPFSGSKIDWKRVPGAVECFAGETSNTNKSAKFTTFFNEVCDRFALIGPVVYIGDSATGFALAGSVETIRRVLSILIETPQHHFFVGPNASWCICFTMEGDMDFGAVAMTPFH